MFNNGIFIISIILMTGGCEKGKIKEKSPTNAQPIEHTKWNKLLNKHVNEKGKVTYKAFIKDTVQLKEYLNELSTSHPHKGWSKKQRKAYWINAYNAFTISLILKHFPVNSIRDIGPIYKTPWKIKFIEIEGKEYSLGDIEHRILRANYGDPRIHYAINCASVSCPPLRKEAYKAEKLDEQLNDQAERFINDSSRNKISKKEVNLSQIYDWFSEDFKKDGGIIEHINKYSETKVNKNAAIEYCNYNWQLNN
ncbi:MAG: DUF547 domain-containing protein [Flavobacteriales bacterium]